ncbi:MAG: pseudaminic acid biosynthesis-associated methylase [Candidatus Sulfotelmatobacter sp.]|jgi:pseudaminic acid biosynthesis-associated methylase
MGLKTTNETEQVRTWSGDFGREYTDRNIYTPAELDELYRRNYGVSRTELNRCLLQEVPRDARILEVGCNIGNQLLLLQEMGFHNLCGIEIQSYALERAKERVEGAALTQASVLAIPYADRNFDLVFTSGVLIHIAPADLPTAMDEIHRCAKQWIWGFEYYAPEMTEVAYRGHEALLWKTDYARSYLERFHDLELVREDRMRYLDNENVDTAFLLRRKAWRTVLRTDQGEA